MWLRRRSRRRSLPSNLLVLTTFLLHDYEFEAREGVPSGVPSRQKSRLMIQNFSFSFADKVSYHCISVALNCVIDTSPVLPRVFICSVSANGSNDFHCSWELYKHSPKDRRLRAVIFNSFTHSTSPRSSSSISSRNRS